MKKNVVMLLVIISLVLGSAIGATASTGLEAIKASLNHKLKFKLDGMKWQPKTDAGLAIAPISYNGTTYLPVRAVAEAMNVAVNFDKATDTVLLGELSEGVPVTTNQVEPFFGMVRTKDKDKTIANGVDYKEVFYAEDVTDYVGVSLRLYPEKKYQKLYLQLITKDGDLSVIAVDYESGTQILDTEVIKADGITTIEIEVGGVESISVELRSKVPNTVTDVIVPISSYYK